MAGSTCFRPTSINGDTGTVTDSSGTSHSFVPTQFTPPTSTATTLLPGGTYLVSDVGGGVTTGQIGDIRIGGNATNFTTMALDTDLFTFPSADPVTGPQVSNFFIGGQTDNVILVAPSGSRNVFFGQGMDNTYINTEFIQNLQANRGAVGSAVTVKRAIGNMIMGGDVISSFIQSGYDQELSAVANSPVTSIQGQTDSGRGSVQRRGPADDHESDLQYLAQPSHLQPPGTRRRADPWKDRGQRDQFDHLGLGRPESFRDQQPRTVPERHQHHLPVWSTK